MDIATADSRAFARRTSLECLNHFAVAGMFNESKYQAIQQHRQRYIEALGTVASDTTPEVMRAVCKGFNLVVEGAWDFLQENHYSIILKFMLQASQNPDYSVRLNALEVWISCSGVPDSWGTLCALLPELIPTLLTNMIFADADYMCMDASHQDDDNASRPDSPDDIKPRFHKESQNIDGDEDDDGKPQKVGHGWGDEWTARKAAAKSLDLISGVFQNEVMNVLLPLIQQKLEHASWEHQEAGVLALGAV